MYAVCMGVSLVLQRYKKNMPSFLRNHRVGCHGNAAGSSSSSHQWALWFVTPGNLACCLGDQRLCAPLGSAWLKHTLLKNKMLCWSLGLFYPRWEEYWSVVKTGHRPQSVDSNDVFLVPCNNEFYFIKVLFYNIIRRLIQLNTCWYVDDIFVGRIWVICIFPPVV